MTVLLVVVVALVMTSLNYTLNTRNKTMSRGCSTHNEYEYSELQKHSFHTSKSLKSYREKYLALRKTMREYSKSTGTEFPEDIKKDIGLK